MPAGEFLGGAALLALAIGSAVVFAVVVVRRRMPSMTGSPQVLAGMLLAIVGFLAIHFVPGVLGILGKPSVAACAVLLLLASTRIPAAPRAEPQPSFPPAPPSGTLSWVFAGIALGLVGLYALAFAAELGGLAIGFVDTTTFHLPNVAGWIEHGTFWVDDEFVPFRTFGTYPNTSDILSLGLILPFDNDFLVRFVNLPALTMIVLAVYALGRELGAPSAPALLFGAGVAAMPVVINTSFNALSDTLMLATYGTGVLFLLRHRRTGLSSELVLAGVALGVCFGTKWYAPPAVVITVAAWVGVALLERQPARVVLTRLAAVTGLVAAAGGFWLVRNWVEVGNPVFPVKVELGGLTLFDAPRDVHRERLGFSLADYLDEPDVWRDVLWPRLLEVVSTFALLLLAMIPLAGGLAWSRRRAQGVPAREILLCLAAATGIAVFYLFIPYTALGPEGDPNLAGANARYVVPALLLAAAMGAWASGRLGRARLVFEGVALLFFFDALRRNMDVPNRGYAAAVALVALAGGVWFVVRTLQRRGELSWRSPAAVGAAAGAAGLALAGMYAQEQRFNDGRYAESEETSRWVIANAPSDKRVGIAGDGFVVYQLFGPRLENEVEYVGRMVDGMLKPYTDRREFEDALRRGRYDVVLVGHNDYISPGLPQQHERWLRDLGYELVATGSEYTAGNQRKTLYRSPVTGS